MVETESRIFELKVGIFIAAAIIIFFIIVFSIGDVYLVRKGYYINVTFNFANGIRKSAPVRLAGVNVGQVDKIDIYFDKKEEKTKVRLVVWVDNDKIKIEKNSMMFINTLGLLGEKYLEIFPGTVEAGFLRDKDVIKGQDPISTQAITDKLMKIADLAEAIMMRLEEGKGTIGKLLVEEKIYDDLASFVEDIKKHPWKLLHKTKEKR